MFPNDYQNFIYTRTYARWLDDEKRREVWSETVDRYFDGILYKIPQELLDLHSEAYDVVLNLDVMPSMRALWTIGSGAAERENAAIYNCSYITIDSIRSFAELLYLLMNGTGVGYSVERQVIVNLPSVPDCIERDDSVVIVADSKKGWAEGLYNVLRALWQGKHPTWDLSRVRPAGARLKVFGGRASGPFPLDLMLKNVVRIIYSAQGRKLNSLECHDICCHIASAVVVGGVRRSACICLSNLSDDRMAKCKSGDWYTTNPQRALANISTAYTERPDARKFLSEFVKLIESKSGERGFFNREAAKLAAINTGRRKEDCEFGTNPCVTGDTIIQTILGPLPIQELTKYNELGVYTMLPDRTIGIRKATDIRRTKTQAKIITVKTQKGDIKCTPNHPFAVKDRHGNPYWIDAKDLKKGDKLFGFCRSMQNESHIKVGISGYQQSEHRLVAQYCHGPLGDKNVHHIDNDPRNNSILNLQVLPHGIHSSISNVGHDDWCDRCPDTGMFLKKDVVKKKESLPPVSKRGCGKAVVICIEDIGEIAPVFNMEVEDTQNYIANGVVVHNCGEILLRPYEFCNLSEVVIRPNDDLPKLCKKIKLATFLGIVQSTYTDFKFVRRDFKRNCEEERLLGVSLTGLRDHPALQRVDTQAKLWLQALKETAIQAASDYSKAFGINMPCAITCVKPSGTVSQLVDSSSGIHPRLYQYYIRRVGVTTTDPVAAMLIDKGVPRVAAHGDDPANPRTWLFEFPMESPRDALLAGDVNAIEQLEYWYMLKKYYCEHNPSATIYVKEREYPGVAAWIYDHWDMLCGLTLLPYDDNVYINPPYEEIDRETYLKLKETFPKELNFKRDLPKYEQGEDQTIGAREFACQGGGCEL